MDTTDNTLINMWRRHGDAEAFRELANRHAPMVYAVCRRILGNVTEAEDIAQECFERLAKSVAQPCGNIGAWLHRVAANRAIDRIRTEGHRREREEQYASASVGQEAREWDEVYACIDDAIAALPEQYRCVIVAHFLENQSHAKIAEQAGMPRRTVTNRIAKGIELIRASLRKRGIQAPSTSLMAFMTERLANPDMPEGLAATLGKLALSGRASSSVLTMLIGAISRAKVMLLVCLALGIGSIWMSASTRIAGDQPPLIEAAPITSAHYSGESVTSLPALIHTRSYDATESLAQMEPSEATSPTPTASSGASITGVGSIGGRVRFRGQAMAGMEVQLYTEYRTEPSVTKTDPSGVYVFNDAPPGDYTILACLTPTDASDYPKLNRREQVSLQPGATVTADFDFPASGGFLEGVITYHGQQVLNCRIGKCQLWLADASGAVLYGGGGGIGANGRFAFEKVPGGTASLEVWATIKDEERATQLRQSEQFEMPEHEDRFLQIELEAQEDSLVVHLQGLTQQFDGSVSILKGNIQLEERSVDYLESLRPLMITGRNLRGQSALQFGKLDPGVYTILLMAIDRQYSEAPHEEQLDNAWISTENVTIVEGEASEITFSLDR